MHRVEGPLPRHDKDSLYFDWLALVAQYEEELTRRNLQ